MNDQHGYHMNLLAQNYEFSTINQPQFAYSTTHGIHQSFGVGLNEHGYRSFNECSSSQRHIESSHNQYEIREDEATFDLCNDAHAQKRNENSKDDESSEDDGESQPIESESDENIGDLPQKYSGEIPTTQIIVDQSSSTRSSPAAAQRTKISTQTHSDASSSPLHTKNHLGVKISLPLRSSSPDRAALIFIPLRNCTRSY
ncbi:hypothetical protein H5410_015086 [Solanum commersonii]|uniref:Uncharacterized protein n=1 Tax=Solanum commersonii TaxID=4109 RepID=A0A9J5ZSQ9_SOLCO|nr:hypothetical protein H5410_015086 [Solanum commersonii]